MSGNSIGTLPAGVLQSMPLVSMYVSTTITATPELIKAFMLPEHISDRVADVVAVLTLAVFVSSCSNFDNNKVGTIPTGIFSDLSSIATLYVRTSTTGVLPAVSQHRDTKLSKSTHDAVIPPQHLNRDKCFALRF